jgi:hypothetical protein
VKFVAFLGRTFRINQEAFLSSAKALMGFFSAVEFRLTVIFLRPPESARQVLRLEYTEITGDHSNAGQKNRKIRPDGQHLSPIFKYKNV